RQVADQLDIAAGDTRQQPVRRQPAERDREAEDGGKENADHRDNQRVQKTDEEDADVAVRPRIRDQSLADVKARIVLQEAEAGGDALRRQIGARVGDDLGAEPEQRGDEQNMEDKTAPDRATAERAPQSEDKMRRG